MYKYLQLRPEKQKKEKKIEDANTGVDDDDDASVEDPELEKFANKEMDREMKRMA